MRVFMRAVSVAPELTRLARSFVGRAKYSMMKISDTSAMLFALHSRTTGSLSSSKLGTTAKSTPSVEQATWPFPALNIRIRVSVLGAF